MLTILSGDLSPTPSYARRSWCWVSNGTGEVVLPSGEVIPGLGVLTIKVQHARKYGAKCEVDSYVVVEADPAQPGCRTYWLLNITDRDQFQPYECSVGQVCRCRCKAGACHKACKHEDSIAAAERAGAFDAAQMATV